MKVFFLMVLYVVIIQIVYNMAPGIAIGLAGVGVIYALHDAFG